MKMIRDYLESRSFNIPRLQALKMTVKLKLMGKL
jgi:hypothetical protein